MDLVAWANLVGPMVQTRRDCDVETGAIRAFLDNLDDANERTLDISEWEFASHVTDCFARCCPAMIEAGA